MKTLTPISHNQHELPAILNRSTNNYKSLQIQDHMENHGMIQAQIQAVQLY